MKLKRLIESVPGGMMMVPLLCGAAITTVAPHAGAFFGSFTNGLFTGSLSILAVFYVCMGATIAVRSLPRVARRGGALLLAKICLGIAAGLILGRILGTQPIASGWFAGISTLAVVAAINNTNGGLYMALMSRYGSAEDAASYSVMALESGPFFTMVTLGVAGLSSFPWQTLIGAILPMCVGMLLGNLDPELRLFLGQAVPVLIPFFAFALGAAMDLHSVWAAGVVGLVLGLAILLVSAVVLIVVDRLVGGEGTAGIAAATTAGSATAVPALIVAANHQYAAAGQPATVLVASSVVVTSLLAPPMTAWWHAHMIKQRAKRVAGISEQGGD
jgi:2-keto-3-deoxygluconate permease